MKTRDDKFVLSWLTFRLSSTEREIERGQDYIREREYKREREKRMAILNVMF